MSKTDFSKVLELFESNGWVLQESWGNYRVFCDPKNKNKLPFLIPVNDKKVSIVYYEKVKEFFDHGTGNT